MGTIEKEKGEPMESGPVDAAWQHKDYAVLPKSERDKGFIRPVRTAYKHVGSGGPKHPVRDLTKEERMRHHKFSYVKYEKYPESESPKLGRFWTQEQLDKVGVGCGAVTTMAKELAETYARDPKYYGATYCSECKTHPPVGEFVWNGTEEVVGS